MLGLTDDEDEVQEEKELGFSGRWLLVLLGLLMLPAAGIAAVFYWAVLMVGRQKRSVAVVLAAAGVAAALVYGAAAQAWTHLGAGASSLMALDPQWSQLVPAATVFYVSSGVVLGAALCLIQIGRMVANPSLVLLEGSWMHGFRFRRTPWELLRLRRTVKALKAGAFNSDDKAPLGVDETVYDTLGMDSGGDVVYRFNSDALRQTLISGAAGSGKAVSMDALILTPDRGFIQNRDLKAGDLVCTPDGGAAKVEAFSPMRLEQVYRLRLDDGSLSEPVSADHRFTVWGEQARQAAGTSWSGSSVLPAAAVSRLTAMQTEADQTVTADSVVDLLGMGEGARSFVERVLERVGPCSEVEHQGQVVEVRYPAGPSRDALLLAGRALAQGGSVEAVPQVVTTSQIQGLLAAGEALSIPVSAPLQAACDVSGADRWVLGAWLAGDHHPSRVRVRTLEGVPERLLASFRKEGRWWVLDPGVCRLPLEVSRLNPYGYKWLKEEGLGDLQQRCDMMSGMLAAAGRTDGVGVVLRHRDQQVVALAARTMRTLGMVCKVTRARRLTGVVWQVETSSRAPVPVGSPFFTFSPDAAPQHRFITEVVPEGRRHMVRCLSVGSPEHLFLMGENMLATHNTITMLSLILNDIQAGLPVVVLDMKRDPSLAARLAKWAHENDRGFYHFVNGDPESYSVPLSSGQAAYEPLVNGGAAKADMLLGMREYDTAAAVYKASMRQLLQVLFRMLQQADRSKAPRIDWDHGGISQVASVVNGTGVQDLVVACEGKPIQADAENMMHALSSRSSNSHKALEELQVQMRTLTASEYGPWLRTSPDRPVIDLFELTKEGQSNVVLFSVNSDSERDFAQFLGALVMADLNAVSAKRRNLGQRNQVSCYIDEFQVIPPTAFVGLLEKSRGSGLAMTISSQSYEQIVASADKNGEAFLSAILDTCSNFIVHSGFTEKSAIRIAETIGKTPVTRYSSANDMKSFLLSWNFSERRSKRVQTRQEEDWKFPPSRFMELEMPGATGRSTAVVVQKSVSDPRFKKAKGTVARTVWMVPNSKVLEPVETVRTEAAQVPSSSQAAAPRTSDPDAGGVEEMVCDIDDDGGFTWEEVPEPEEEPQDPVPVTSQAEGRTRFVWETADSGQSPHTPSGPRGGAPAPGGQGGPQAGTSLPDIF